MDKFEFGEWKSPVRVTTCNSEARPGYTSKKAHEYLETADTLRKKIKELARLIKSAKNCVIYSGAGISTSSGINDYASKAKSSLSGCNDSKKKKLKSPLLALPTSAHVVLTAMQQCGMVSYWIQQNHDGLPQKAGYPQHLLNEIHGAWFDPSNAVVPMSGELRGDYFQDLLDWEEKADLVLALGTSMCGMNADRVVTTCAKKSAVHASLGSVIINLQRTQYDALATLRIYAKLDNVMLLLANELGIEDKVAQVKSMTPYTLPKQYISDGLQFQLPYDSYGRRTSTEEATILDLRPGKTVMITAGNYRGDLGEVTGRSKAGDFLIRFKHNLGRHTKKKCFVERRLGSWWIEEAMKGRVKTIPIVNYHFQEISEQKT